MVDPECSICLDFIKEKNKKTLVCDHFYHNECIIKWFENKNDFYKCPLCRKTQILHDIDIVIEDNIVEDNNNIDADFNIVVEYTISSTRSNCCTLNDNSQQLIILLLLTIASIYVFIHVFCFQN